MLPTIYEVASIGEGQLSVMAKPVGGEWLEDEIAGLKQLDVNHVVSLLEPSEEHDVGLVEEASLCRSNNIKFTSFPIPDRGLPDSDAAHAISSDLFEAISTGEHVVIHCRAGIGRTGIMASAILIKSGCSAQEALQAVSKARGVEVPDTDEQIQWVHLVEQSGM